MAHYLYVLQTVRLNHLEPRMRTPLDSYSQVYFHSVFIWFLSRSVTFISHTHTFLPYPSGAEGHAPRAAAGRV